MGLKRELAGDGAVGAGPTGATGVPGTVGNPRRGSWAALVGWLVVCYAVAGLGARASVGAIPTWYAGLAKPALNPPDWLFGPVWVVLYTAMAVAAWLGWRTRDSRCRVRAMRLFVVQLLLNLMWSWIFFGRRRPDLALIEIALLLAGIALTTQALAVISRRAAWLMAPYLAWVTFAAYLNWGIWRLNR